MVQDSLYTRSMLANFHLRNRGYAPLSKEPGESESQFFHRVLKTKDEAVEQEKENIMTQQNYSRETEIPYTVRSAMATFHHFQGPIGVPGSASTWGPGDSGYLPPGDFPIPSPPIDPSFAIPGRIDLPAQVPNYMGPPPADPIILAALQQIAEDLRKIKKHLGIEE